LYKEKNAKCHTMYIDLNVDDFIQVNKYSGQGDTKYYETYEITQALYTQYKQSQNSINKSFSIN